jgi:hypothetical protein
VAIPFDHFVRLVSKPAVDEPLIDATSRAVAGEGMPEDVEAADDGPSASVECTMEVVLRLVDGDGGDGRPSFLTPRDLLALGNGERPAGVLAQPRTHDLGEEK